MDDPGLRSSVTEGWVALDHFTDRHAAIRRFAEYLNEDPPPESVLYFHGESGNGKTLLLRYLQRSCAKRMSPEEWREASAKTGDAFVACMARADLSTNVPCALIDFEEGASDRLAILLKLHRQLAQSGLHFLVFSYACVNYWEKSHQLTSELVESLFPGEGVGYTAGIQIPTRGTKALEILTSYVQRNLAMTFSEWISQRDGLTDAVAAMERWDVGELVSRLPDTFAAEVNDALAAPNAPARIVLMFDSHDRFEGTPRGGTKGKRPECDVWLRTLMENLGRSRGVVIVIAGREHPDRWRCYPAFDAMLIDELSVTAAHQHLERNGQTDRAIWSRLAELATIGEDRVHPLLIGLALDVAIVCNRNAELLPQRVSDSEDVDVIGRALLSCLLQSADDLTRYALKPLAASRSFSDDVFYHLIGHSPTIDAAEQFRTLTELSFVQPTFKGLTYTMHDRVRRLLREQATPEGALAHEQLEAFFRREENDAARTEAIYHANQLDPERGLREWFAEFETRMRTGQWDRCRTLQDLVPWLSIPSASTKGSLFWFLGSLEARLSQHIEALAMFKESAACFELALTGPPGQEPSPSALQYNDHLINNELSLPEEAWGEYSQSVAAYERELLLPIVENWFDDFDLEALNKRAGFAKGINWYENALSSYADSVVVLGTALRLAEIDPDQFNDENLLDEEANRFQGPDRYENAMEANAQRLDRVETALLKAPENPALHTAKGDALASRGLILFSPKRKHEARVVFRQSVVCYETALRLGPDDPDVYVKKGNALASLGDLHFGWFKNKECFEFYDQSVAAFEEASRLSPATHRPHLYKATELSRKGSFLSLVRRHQLALVAYSKSSESYKKAHELAPTNIRLLLEHGSMLSNQGKIYSLLGQQALRRKGTRGMSGVSFYRDDSARD
jgi:tetratricopeptide (TPR) repeat protein